MASKSSKVTTNTREEDQGAKPIASTLIQEFQSLKDKFKNEDENGERESPFQNIEKSTVLQECRVFHDASVVTQNPRKCAILLTKLLFLIVKGESFSSTEVTEVFFGVTKLFQSDDVSLRRMMYLFIKEIAETCNPDDIIIVTSSLTKDMNTGEDLFRANSMRVLAKIIDSTMLSAIERYLKQAIVDRNAFVASSALMAGLRLFSTCPEVVRRWINEVQEAVNSSSEMVQYHALSLLYKIRQHDRLAISKIVQQLSKGSLRSPLATCLLIRYTSDLLREDQNATSARAAYSFLESCLRHKNEMVIYEAAKAICNLPNVEAADLSPAITVLQLFLSSPKPALRFAAMRTLSEVAVAHPVSVSKCNDDMESLVSDGNRSIATLAITTLLKTGNEASIDRLMKQITSFMNEIGDEFKIVVVKAIRELCLKYHQKHGVLIGFMAKFLREEGGFEFKQSIVDSIVDLMTAIPETKETSLLHLCEFIEDCEYDSLIIQILDLIGSLGPATPSPSKYIRFVVNRLILESATVRAGAITTLGNFATRVSELRPSVEDLLRRSLLDDDNEVRDRASILLSCLKSCDDSNMKFVMDEPLPMTFTALERSLRAFAAHPSSNDSKNNCVTLNSLPIIEDSYVPPSSLPSGRAAAAAAKKTKPSASSSTSTEVAEVADPAAAVYKVSDFAALGRAFRSTAVKALTESEMEYVVTCVKHIFESHIVLQFSVTNTIDDQKLRDVRVVVEPSNDSVVVDKVIPAAFARYGEPTTCFVSLQRVAGSGLQDVECGCQLAFKVVQVNPQTGEVEGDEDGYDEEYPLESLTIHTRDYMGKVTVGDFRRSWESMGNEGEVLEKYGLPYKRLDEAMNAVLDYLNMQAVDGTGAASAIDISKRMHTIHLSGVFVGNVPVLARCMIQLDDDGVVVKLAVRSQDRDVSRLVADCIN